MEELSPSQQHLRSRIETGISLASPFLDAVLAVGERISRLAEPRDYEHYPVREDDDRAGRDDGPFSARKPRRNRPGAPGEGGATGTGADAPS